MRFDFTWQDGTPGPTDVEIVESRRTKRTGPFSSADPEGDAGGVLRNPSG